MAGNPARGTRWRPAAEDPSARLAAELRTLQAISGKTLRDLEPVLHASSSSLSRYLNGRSLPPRQVVESLCAIAGRQSQELLTLWQASKQSRRMATIQRVDHGVCDPDRELGQPSNTADLAGEVDGAADLPARVGRLQGLRSSNPPLIQIPAAPAGFAGREAELRQLSRLVSVGTDPSGSVVLLVGMAGVGKTALALSWAHSAQDQYPDGRFYLDLNGFSAKGHPITTDRAILTLLDLLGVPPQQIPQTSEGRTGRYRDIVAARDMLLVLDNARDSDQVRPLLPPTSNCHVLVTSRHNLAGLVALDGARRMTLGPLSNADARDLLTLRLGEDRIIEQSDAVGQLIDRCAGLPLALTVTAARAASFDTVSVSVLVDELDAASSALDMFETGDGPTGVRTVLTWSYRHLSPEAAQLFRLLSVHPGPDISLAATAALADATESVARKTILELCTLSLAAEHVPGRYRLHSILRTFASEVAAAQAATRTNATTEVSDPATDQRGALRRVVDYYLRTSIRAAHFISVAAPSTAAVGTVSGISSGMEALAWFATEHDVLTAILSEADRAGFDSLTWRLATAWSSYLYRRGMWVEDVACCLTGLAAAQRSAESDGQAALHRQLGRAFARRRDSDKSIQRLQRALDLYRTSDNRLGQAEAWRTVAALHALDGSHAEAVDAAQQASELYRTADHREGHAAALNEIGWSLRHLGRLDQALTLCRRAIDTLRSCEAGGRRSAIEASVHDSLGGIHHRLGHHAEAVSCYAASIRLFDELAEPPQNALARTRLGDVHADAGDFELARTSWTESLAILDRLGNAMGDLWGSESGIRRLMGCLGDVFWSGCDVVLAGQAAEDGFAA